MLSPSAERFPFPTGGRTGNGRTERRHKAPNIKATRGGPGGRDPLARAGRERQAGRHFSTERLSKGGRRLTLRRGETSVRTSDAWWSKGPSVSARTAGPTPAASLQGCGRRLAPPVPFFRERRAQSAGWTGCPRSAGVSAGRRLRLVYLMSWSLPGRWRHSPRIRPVTAPASAWVPRGGGTRAPSPGSEAPAACHPGLGRFQQAQPQNTV